MSTFPIVFLGIRLWKWWMCRAWPRCSAYTTAGNRNYAPQNIFLTRVFAVFALACSGELLFAQEAVIRSDPADWLATLGVDEQRFIVVESKHFSLATDVDRNDARLWLEQLETTYSSVERFTTSMKLPFAVLSNKLRVIVFATADDLKQFTDRTHISIQQSDGLYIVEPNVSVFVDAASHPLLRRVDDQIKALQLELNQLYIETTDPKYQKWRGSIRLKIIHLQQRRDRLTLGFNRVVLRHEAAHQIFYNTGIHNEKKFSPLWFREGLACLFETTPIENADAAISVNRPRLFDLPWLNVFRQSNTNDDITANDTKLHKAVTSCRDAALALIGDDEFLSAAHADAPQRYAQAWALVYYLSQSFPQAFAKYIKYYDSDQLVDRNIATQRLKTFEAMFGKLDDDFCTRWLKYIASKRLDHNPVSR